jgi:DNA-binding NtrC family response regulator
MTTLPAHVVEEGLVRAARRRDRRLGLGHALATVSRTLADRSADTYFLSSVFEESFRRLLPVRSVRLRDAASRRTGAREEADAIESMTVDLPGGHGGGVLEATLDPASPLGDWDVQLLGIAANIGALVLEIERGRLQLTRAGYAPVAKAKREPVPGLIGSTPAMQALRSQIDLVASTDFTVLLEGESGVGKELVARQIHELSRRRSGPFVAINCAALVDTLLEAELFGIEERTATGVRGRRGKFEHADGGTLFLDEVSDLSASAQAKLLRAIQDLAVERVGGHGSRRVDIRIVAATNRSLGELVERGAFRPDLFYRLAGVDLRVPTLRERRADIRLLATSFLERHRATRPRRLSAVAEAALVEYSWPGNVRELERVVERIVALTSNEVISLEDLPPSVRGGYATILIPSLEQRETMRAWGRRYARLVVERCRGNKREASRFLGISYHTLMAYLRDPLDVKEGDGSLAATDEDTGEVRRDGACVGSIAVQAVPASDTAGSRPEGGDRDR